MSQTIRKNNDSDPVESDSTTDSERVKVLGVAESQLVYSCRRCGVQKETRGLCEQCLKTVMRNTGQAKADQLQQAAEARVGRQMEFWAMALLVWPLSFSGSLLVISRLHPAYTLGKDLFAASFVSGAMTTVASWLLLFVYASSNDLWAALMSLRSFTRLYRQAEFFRAKAPRLFALHIVAFAITVALGFGGFATEYFTSKELVGLVHWMSIRGDKY